jgi:ATP-dependent DNA helicase PIF1
MSFLTGEPGSGKTHTVNAYVKYLRERGVEPAITASTGIAATHIGGYTIHSWSGIGVKRDVDDYDIEMIHSKEKTAKRIINAKVLIIDEISMLDAATLGSVDRVLRSIRRKVLQEEEPFGGLQIVFVGDFFQLPPVSKSNTASFAFQLAVVERRQSGRLLYRRAAPARRRRISRCTYEHAPWHLWQRASRTIAKAHRHQTPVLQPSRRLYTHNADVDRINKEELAKIEDEGRLYACKRRERNRSLNR